jgi:MFS transporter, MHS family, alpha-ketoglutarate permease
MNAQPEFARELPAAPTTPAITRRQWVSSIVAGTIGNAVEAFDWMIYTAFAIYFGKQFFPSDNSTVTLLSAFAVFAVGFAMRPLGGWAMGAFSDRFGRRSGLMLTILAMAGSSLIIAFLPTYSSIGILAPILLTSLRMLQGLSVGGEYSAATLFLAESAPPKRRGFFTSFQFGSVAVGMLLSSAMSWAMAHYMSRDALEAWGWRVPFFIGGCGALVGFWMRRHVAETASFEQLKREGRVNPRSLWWTWSHHPKAVLRLVGITVLGAFSFYLFVSFMPVYAIRHAGAHPEDAFAASTVTIAIFMITQPLFGALSDRIGRRPQLIVFALGYLLFLYPVIRSIGPSFGSMLLVECFGMLLYGLYTAIAPAVMAELFPTEVRGVGIGAAYNLVVALLGGTTPYLMTAAQTHQREGWFIAYVCVGALIGLVTFWRMPETVGIELK